MNKFLLLCLTALFLFVNNELWAQERTISGRVTAAEDGGPLPGVSILLKGTTVGTATDADGRYTLQIPATGGTLVASFIGLRTQEVEVGTRSAVDLSMEAEVTQLSEVVVTALGIERSKNELPFAAQEVRGDEVTRNRQTNFVNALSGKIAGLDVRNNNNMGGSTNVVIRGYKSITSNNQALFVIDGIPVSNANTNTAAQMNGQQGFDYGNAASDINPDNIASINVLKGAAATALYGSRASNGVIMITTKKGRKNSFEVTVNSGVTFGTIDKTTFAKYQNEYGQGYTQAFRPNETYNGESYPVPNFTVDASFGPRFEGQMVYQWDAFDPAHPNYHTARPWLAAKNGPETFYETSVNSNQSVSLNGGSDKTIFALSYTRTDEKGVLPNSRLDKDLFSFNFSTELTSKLSVGAAANYSHIKGVGRYGTGYANTNPNQTFRQWWPVNVDIKEQKDAYFRNRQNITWNWNSTRTGAIYANNPYWTRYENFANDDRDNYFGYANATYKITDWLDVMGRVAVNTTQDFQEERLALGSNGVARYARFDRSFRETNYDLTLNFNKKLTEDVTLKGIVGGNMRRSLLTSSRASTNGGLAVPRLYALSNSRSPIIAPTEEYQRVGVDGIFASATVGYKELVFVDLAARQDKSTTLPKDNNTYFYPSVAASFVFSNVLKQSWLSNGKFRVNYAEVGNDAPALSVYSVYDKPTAIGTVPLFSNPNIKSNPTLKSERTRNIEAGIDADFFDGRVGFDFTWYQSNTFDQIIPVAVTTATGYSQKFVNSGEVENKGIEVSAFVVPLKTDDFSWTMNVNFARNRNEVLSLYGEGDLTVKNVPISQPQGGVTLNAAVGQPYGIIRGTNFVYTNGEKTVNSKGYYMATASSAEIIGDPNPDWLGGVNNTFKYKDLTLSFLVDVRKGGDIFSLDQWYGDGSGLTPITAGLNELGNPKRDPVASGGGVLFPGVKEDGTPNDIRAENNNGSGNTAYGYTANGQAGMPRAAYVFDGSYVKLREVALTYSLPASVMNKLRGIKSIDISLIGRNLWIIHKNMEMADPEESLSSGNANQGYQSGAYPAVRNYGFNVRFKI